MIRRSIRIGAVALVALLGCVMVAQAKLVNLADWTAAKFETRDAMYEACVSATSTSYSRSPNVLFDGTIFSMTEGATTEWRGKITEDNLCAVTFTIPSTVPDNDLPALDRYLLHRSPFWYSQSNAPSKWELQGRNSESEEWTTIDHMENAVFDRRGGGNQSPACECTHERALTSRVKYRSYRIVFLEALSADYTEPEPSLQEIEFVVDDGTSGTVHYVSPDGTGDGTSWANAASLQTALTAAEAEDELWLKAGDYTLTAELAAPTACSILGGFAGTESAKSEREDSARSTIIGTAVTNAIVMTDTSFRDYILENLIFTNALHRAIKMGAYGDSSASELAKMKSGAGLRAKNCSFVCNGVTLQDSFTDGIRGRGAWIYTPKGAPVVFEDCVFDRNRNLYTASKRHSIVMNGMALNVNFCELTLTRCVFTNNGVPETVTTGGADGRDGTRGAAIYANGATIKATDCLFRGNRPVTNNASRDGSVIVIEGSPSGTSSFVGCCFVGNSYAKCGDSISSTIEFVPGTVYRATAFPLLFNRCTMAYNLGQSCGGLRVDNAALTVRNSIFYGNFMQSTLAVAADIEVLAGATADIDYSLFADSSKIGGTGTITRGDGVVYGDPLFKTTLETVAAQVNSTPVAYPTYTSPGYFSPDYDLSTINVHVEARVSPAIDAGDPTADYANEPTPNGGRLNLGYYGNTSEAATSSTATPVISSSSVTFSAANSTKPTVSLVLQSADDTYSATVYFCCGYEKPSTTDETGWQFVETIGTGATPGTSIEVLTKRYLEAGKTLYWRIVVRGGAGFAVVDGPSEGVTVTGEKPALWGKGLGEGYLHIRAGADGLGDGSDWLNAAPTIVDAVSLVTETLTNLVIAGTVPAGTTSMGTLSIPVSIYGGFVGGETSFDARTTDYSTIDGEDAAKNCLVIANTTGETRVDGILFTRSTGSAVDKTLAGDLTFANSRFFNCGSPDVSPLLGRSLKADGASAATLTITNCVFDRNVGKDGGNDSFTGTAGYLTAFKAVNITDTLYATNGVNHSNTGAVNGREGLNGSTLYVDSAPLTLTNCRFIGNRYVVHNGNQKVCCAVEITGNSPTTMKNCLFTGNGGYATEDDAAFSPKRSGAVVFHDLKAATTAVTVENCTFAYNMSTKGVSAFTRWLRRYPSQT